MRVASNFQQQCYLLSPVTLLSSVLSKNRVDLSYAGIRKLGMYLFQRFCGVFGQFLLFLTPNSLKTGLIVGALTFKTNRR